VTVRSDAAGHLAAALDQDELVALEWAASCLASLCDHPYPGEDRDAALATGRRLRQLGPTLRDAVRLSRARAAGFDTDHDCTSCGCPLSVCDDRIGAGRKACCTLCSIQDTHDDTPSGYADRLRAKQAADALVADAVVADGRRRGLKVFTGLKHRRVPGLQGHRTQMSCIVAARSQKAAAQAADVTLSELRRHWSTSGAEHDVAAAMRQPGLLLYRPLDANEAPWVPWADPYPVESIPGHLREPELRNL
jgi:hypothetical protein